MIATFFSRRNFASQNRRVRIELNHYDRVLQLLVELYKHIFQVILYS